MAKVILKYPVAMATGDAQTVMIPLDAKPVHAGLDPKLSGQSMVWMECDSTMPEVEVWVGYFWTGKPIPNGIVHVGSHINDGWEVRHVYIGPLDARGRVTAPDQVIANLMANNRLKRR